MTTFQRLLNQKLKQILGIQTIQSACNQNKEEGNKRIKKMHADLTAL